MKKYLFSVILLAGLICSVSIPAFAVLPTITPGTVTTTCAGTYSTMSYTATASPTTYNITWIGSPVGLPDVPPGTALPLTAIPINVLSTCAGGTYHGTITVTNTSGSSVPAAITITVNGRPAIYSVTGGGSYCAGGTGVHLGLSNSDAGILYQVMRSGVAIGTSVWGTGLPLDFGLYTTAGFYTVTAKNAVTLCQETMSGSATITINSIPPVVSVTGGGGYCAGGAGMPVGLSGSVYGAMYQLYRGGVPTGSAIPGIGMAVDFGPQTISGVYTVIARDTTSGCSANMTGSASVFVNPNPTVFSVTGGGNYCAGGYGVHVGLSGSSVGVSYKLYHGGAYVMSLTGSGGPLDYGMMIPAGNYTVRAVNGVYGCTSNMSDTAIVSLIPVVVPTLAVSSGEPDNKICAGHTTVFSAVTTHAGPSPTYVWTINGAFAGTGSSYTYIPSQGDHVHVAMTSDATCAVPNILNHGIFMTVLEKIVPTVVVNAYPGVNIVNGQTDTATAVFYNGGVTPTFQWYVNGVLVAGATSRTLISNAFKNNDVLTCKVMGCADSAGSGSITIHVVPRTGVNDLNTDSRIQIVPNPSTGSFVFTGNEIAGNNATIRVTDMAGRAVYSEQISNFNGTINKELQLPASTANGIYLISLQTEQERIVARIVVEK